MNSQTLTDYAKDARLLWQTFFPELVIIGDLQRHHRPLLDAYIATIMRRCDAYTGREAMVSKAVAGALKLLMESGKSIMREGTHAAWRNIATPDIHELADEEIETVVQLVNEEFLRSHSVEWTAHGIKRTFRFWPVDEQISYLQYCGEVIDLLASDVGDACFAYGLVLSLVRNGSRLNPHDDDLDVLVALPANRYPTFERGLERVTDVLRAGGHTVSHGKGMVTHRWVSKPDRRAVDVFVGLVEGGTVASYPGPRRTIQYAEMFEPLISEIHGVSCPVPRDPFKYVRDVYGPDWSVPKIVYSHRGSGWRDFADLAGH